MKLLKAVRNIVANWPGWDYDPGVTSVCEDLRIAAQDFDADVETIFYMMQADGQALTEGQKRMLRAGLGL